MSGFTATARVQWKEVGTYQRIIEFGSTQITQVDPPYGLQNSFIWALSQATTYMHVSIGVPQMGFTYGPSHFFYASNIALQLNAWYTLTWTYSSATRTFKIYVDGALRHEYPSDSAVIGPRAVLYTYIGQSLHKWSEPNFSGRMKFLAAYDRALSEAEIVSQHATQAPANVNTNVALTLSFTVPSGAAFKTVTVTGLRFSSFKGAAASNASCSNLDASGVVLSPFFALPDGPLVLNLATAAASAVASAAVECHISGFLNAAGPSAASNATIAVYDTRGLPVITHRNVEFPAIFSASGSGASISLSSYHAGATNVRVSISFIVAAPLASVPFKTISVTGLRFSAFNASAAPT